MCLFPVCGLQVGAQSPWAGKAQPEVYRLASECFEYNEMMFTSFGVTEEQQQAM